ncbi:hypothetical protein Deipr_2446 (plasmid) [Deinococcus proteolyticus MRP]|uniref:Uncharacterized protein n=1 Tax=Deinococcus proteolyticus (strain ATCC 35074 / DSM 20540 / JCM 6276 / NBRC 101906 / NCIMB 13154 / VKM Ac-1939 / CCM 2703 / MRP) TaxID=693977 RepID=F0RQK4_DEIPM|nr:hypothetical protein [Deinococcus proteolyticus]ADY27563.1 hypothetical protein Deipr_2446 [Deinococcus proteolyticus MRP]
MSSIHSLIIFELLFEKPMNVTQIARHLGWSFAEAENEVLKLAELGLIQRGSDRDSHCQILSLHSRSHRTDRITEQAILLGIRRHRTIPALQLYQKLPRDIIEDTLRRELVRGNLVCSCIGMLPVFLPNQPDSHSV